MEEGPCTDILMGSGPNQKTLRGWVVNTNYPVVTNMLLKEKTAHSVIISHFNLDVLVRVGSLTLWACFCLVFSWQTPAMWPCILEPPIISVRLWKKEKCMGGMEGTVFGFVKVKLYTGNWSRLPPAGRALWVDYLSRPLSLAYSPDPGLLADWPSWAQLGERRAQTNTGLVAALIV